MTFFRANGFTATAASPKLLIVLAYDVREFQISGAPAWVSSETYDVDAKVSDSAAGELQKLPFDQRREKVCVMLQSLLAERFNLQVTRATKRLPIYALTVMKNGPRLQPTRLDENHRGGMSSGPGKLTGQGLAISALALLLSEQLDRYVVDQTGLKGQYDFTLGWSPDSNATGPRASSGSGRPAGDNGAAELPGPSIFTATQEQLGLKLEPRKGPVTIIEINHIDRPSEN